MRELCVSCIVAFLHYHTEVNECEPEQTLR